MTKHKALSATFTDAWLIEGARTPFIDYRGALADISPIDLGIKAARAAVARAGVDACDNRPTIARSKGQASFDAYATPRPNRLLSGVPVERPAHSGEPFAGPASKGFPRGPINLPGRFNLCLGPPPKSITPPQLAFTSPKGFSLGRSDLRISGGRL